MGPFSNDSPVTFQDGVPEAVDAVVIGAGVIGTSTAYFLAKQGLKVALCEKGRVAGEQSSRNWGWIRQQGRDPAELPIMIESNRIWRGLAAETGEADLNFRMCGCVYLADDQTALAKYEQWHDLARQHQLDTRMLSAAEAKSMVGDFSGEWVGGMVTPSDGCAEPFVAVPALARAAQASGARVIENCAVRTVETEAGRVTSVATEQGTIKTSLVLLAGGAWSSTFAANLGLDLPQLAVRSTVGRTHIAKSFDLPNLSAKGLSLRQRADGGYTVTSGDLAEHYIGPQSFKYLTKFMTVLRGAAKDMHMKLNAPADYPNTWSGKRRWTGTEESPFERMRVLNPEPSPVVMERVRERLPKQAPWLNDAGMLEFWAGMIDVTPDAVPYLCAAPGHEGLFIATGMSGHGFGIGPGVGRLMADLMRGVPHGFDLHRFRFDRFTDGSKIVPGPY